MLSLIEGCEKMRKSYVREQKRSALKLLFIENISIIGKNQ